MLVFSLIIGLEQRRHHINENEDLLFGTDRTFAFFGLLGYVLFITLAKFIAFAGVILTLLPNQNISGQERILNTHPNRIS
ncbi:MAG: hypothetical protein WCL21_04035 [Mariniphaga sp.]